MVTGQHSKPCKMTAAERARLNASFGLAKVPRNGDREPNGRRQRPSARETADDAQAVAIAARQRRLPKELHDEARSQMAGCAVGRRILMHTTAVETRAALWSAVCHIRSVVTAYDRSIGAPDRHPQCLRILVPVDLMHADAASASIDDRSDAEKSRHAVAALMHLETWLGYTDNSARSACLHAVVDEPDADVAYWPGVLAALQCVSEGLKTGKPVYRSGA